MLYVLAEQVRYSEVGKEGYIVSDVFFQDEGKWVGKQDVEKDSLLKARKQKNAESVRSVCIKDSA